MVVVGCNATCSLCVDKEGNVWRMGNRKEDIEQHPVLRNIRSIACGQDHVVCLDSSGRLWSFGENNRNQLGLLSASTTYQRAPVPVLKFEHKFLEVCCGTSHTVCIDLDLNCWSFGRNDRGQLGLSHFKQLTHPEKIETLSNISAISACGLFTLFKDTEGYVYSTGDNSYGQLGLGNEHTAVCAPTKIPSLLSVDSISTGYTHSLFLVQRALYVCGNNKLGQLGLGTKEENKQTIWHPIQADSAPPAIQASTGNHQSFVIDVNGILWATGNNSHGSLGLGNTESQFSFVQVPGLSEVSILSQYYDQTIVKDLQGQIWVFGNNSRGQLGLGDFNNRLSPTPLPSEYTHIITSAEVCRVKSATK